MGDILMNKGFLMYQLEIKQSSWRDGKKIFV